MKWIKITSDKLQNHHNEPVWICKSGTQIVYDAYIDEYGNITDDDGNTHFFYEKGHVSHFMVMEIPKPPSE